MNAIELFAGAGGLGLGMSKAGFQPIEIIERDHWCCQTLQENKSLFGKSAKAWPQVVPHDIRSVSFKHLEGRAALVSGGPPCQPFSVGGKHRGNSDVRDMWPEAVRVVREVRPKAFVFENVKGLTRSTFASYFNYVLLQLHYPSIGLRKGEDWISHNSRLQQHHTSRGASAEEYRVVFDVLNAANYGVPQRRERVVFVGFRHDLNIKWSFGDAAKFSLDALLWEQVRSGEYWERHRVPRARRTIDGQLHARGMALSAKPSAKPWKTTRDAIADLPDPDRSPNSRLVLNHRFQPGARIYPGHTGSPLDEPAKTLKAGVHGVPGGENMLVREDGSVRYFTIRESARIQTFPDQFQLHGAWSEAMRQLGNAVPVRLGEAVGKSVRDHLARAKKRQANG